MNLLKNTFRLIWIFRESGKVCFSVQREETKEKITSQLLIAIPIAAGIFLSMIGLVLLIRMELHLRKFSTDYREVNLGR